MSFESGYAKRERQCDELLVWMHRHHRSRFVMRKQLPMEPLVFPSDQTLLISQLAVPPQDHGADDELQVVVNEQVRYRCPVRLLIDGYPLMVALECADDLLSSEAAWKLGHLGVHVGVVVPPRYPYQLRTRVIEDHRGYNLGGGTEGSPLEVYLGCIYTRDVA